ncbi:DUF92 domain-containing protein [Bacillus sp. PS06]|uniref:DUF92 domain-containing protein n=1 Tax=Bacillus sp. PS06 TaxID=2764176 RepID=UPI001787764C|nr:DUF92 domain-containing protein [Bacillus sp. PS06]MBD8069141.1 DUF92 domain-containing protein [Bacillus sp. PS06]
MDNHFLLQVIGIVAVAYSGHRLRSLTKTGAMATVIIGVAVAMGFEYRGLGLLGVFFVTSSLWSKFKRNQKSSVEEKVQKGEERDHIQVLANGSVAAMASILNVFFPSDIWLYVFVAAICSANADTWASEIGSLSKQRPILVSSFQRVDAGTSGAVSLLGTLAALGGSLLIAMVSYEFWNEISFKSILLLTLVGFIGNLFDTIFGAVFQVSYICRVCGIETEKTVHCHEKTKYHKGIVFCNNDFINFLSILLASILGALLFVYL